MSQALLCPKCGDEMQVSGLKCVRKGCPCNCGEGHYTGRSLFESRADREPTYDHPPNSQMR